MLGQNKAKREEWGKLTTLFALLYDAFRGRRSGLADQALDWESGDLAAFPGF